MTADTITFSFGENWKNFQGYMTEESVDRARCDIDEWLGRDRVTGARILDIGSGSGIHSLCFHRLGATELVSFDYDKFSVEATSRLHEKCGSPKNWRVMQGSVLDTPFLEQLGSFDIVYAWGVLHHTGSMWTAIENAAQRVRPGGHVWISLYTKGPRYPQDLALKRRYNASSRLGKWLMVRREIARFMYWRLRARKNPFGWNEKQVRGMDTYHDIVDWLGGLPYEVATPEETRAFFEQRGFEQLKMFKRDEGGCSVYLFKKL